MNRRTLWFVLASLLITASAFAEVIGGVAKPAPWWSELAGTILTGLLTGAAALLAWVFRNLKTWISQKASEANTTESAAWYRTAFYLSGIAVRYAEDKFGPDSQTGQKKKAEAVAWLKQRLLSIDPNIAIKTPNLDQLLEGFVAAAYREAFESVSPLASGPAPKQA